MKKIVLSLAGVMAAVAFAPEASALPVFARQTGMACSACHFNHAPLLNGFGRSFKSAGYSMMGSQGKVEGEHLDIPDRVNMAMLTTLGYEKVQNAQGTYTVPSNGGEMSLFMGGRIMDGAGFLAELGLGGAGAATGAAKMLYMPEVMAGTRVGLVVDTNNGQGVAHGFEILNTGAVNVHKIAVGQVHVNAYSAAQYFGTNNATTGLSVVAQNEMGFVNVSAYDALGQANGAGATNLPLTYARVAALFDFAGFDFGAGVQRWTGRSNAVVAGAPVAIPGAVAPAPLNVVPGNYDATVVDVQAQGEIAGLSTGIYASYGKAPVGSEFGQGVMAAGGAPNAFAATSLNVGVDVNVGHEIIARAATRRATNGMDGKGDNALMVGVIYELAQNVELHATRTNNFGDHYNPVAGGLGLATGKATTSLLAEVLF
jgi:hypothetical protein